MRISIDLDGVLSNFCNSVRDIANKLWPQKNLPYDFAPDNWDYEGSLTPDEFRAVWQVIRTTENFWEKQLAYPDNVFSLRRFLRSTDAKGVDIFYITSRAPTVGDTILRQCEEWLINHKLGFGVCAWSIFPVENPAKKVDAMEALGISMSIDDYHENVKSVAGLKNHQPFLLHRPWNAREVVPDNVQRVRRLQDYLDAVLATKEALTAAR